MSSLHRGHANLLCIVPILVYVLLKRTQKINHSEMKNSISQITNSIDRINRLRKCRRMISALGDTTIETIQNKTRKEKY